MENDRLYSIEERFQCDRRILSRTLSLRFAKFVRLSSITSNKWTSYQLARTLYFEYARRT